MTRFFAFLSPLWLVHSWIYSIGIPNCVTFIIHKLILYLNYLMSLVVKIKNKMIRYAYLGNIRRMKFPFTSENRYTKDVTLTIVIMPTLILGDLILGLKMMCWWQNISFISFLIFKIVVIFIIIIFVVFYLLLYQNLGNADSIFVNIHLTTMFHWVSTLCIKFWKSGVPQCKSE